MQFIQGSEMLSAHQCSTSVFQFVYTLKLYCKTIVRFLYNMYHIVVYEIKGHLIKKKDKSEFHATWGKTDVFFVELEHGS